MTTRQSLERRAPFVLRPTPPVRAAELDHVECNQSRRRLLQQLCSESLASDPALQLRERGRTVLAPYDDLAVHDRTVVEACEGIDDIGKGFADQLFPARP